MPTFELLQRLKELNLVLPPAAVPAGAYIPVKRIGELVYIAGQLPIANGVLLATGPVPSRCSVETAQLGARQCVLNALAAILRDPILAKSIRGVVRVGAFIASDPDFIGQPKIANAASELLVEIFGEAGRHVRAAVGVNVLPLNASVEIEFLFHA